jgi:imidazolonepropionase-like amidohydrolase
MRAPIIRIRTGWLLDGTGAAAQTGAILELGEGKVLHVRPPTGQDPPIDVDLCHCTVLPTLVDAHVHLTLSGSADPVGRRRQLDLAYPGAAAVIRRHLEQHLTAGVAAVRDGGDHHGHTLAYKLKEKAGPVYTAVAGRAWHAAGRYGRLIGRPPEGAEDLGEAIARCREPIDQVKIVNSGLNSLKTFAKETAPQFSGSQMRAAVAAATALNLPVMVHANGRRPVAEALAAGCTSIEHGFFMGRQNLAAMAAGGAVWVPTVVTMAAYARQLAHGENGDGAFSGADLDVVRRNRDHQLEQVRLAFEMGVAIAVGTDAGSLGVDHGRAVAEEMRLLAEAGLPLSAVVRAATWNGARLLELGDRGRLTAGQRADFIAVAGPPQTLLSKLGLPDAVFIKGEILPQQVGKGEQALPVRA